MNKSIFKRISRFIISIIFISLITVPTYSYTLIFYPAKDPSNKTILVTGDSYAGYFAAYECLKNHNIIMYAEAGKSTRENYDMMKEAIEAFPDIVVISIGVNDHNKHVPPVEFKNGIEEIVSECKAKNKKVILHTYMNYDTNAFKDQKKFFEISDYDDALKEIAQKYSNAFYIDMSDYNEDKYLQKDRIHYDKAFYDELYNRMEIALLLF